MSSTSTLILFGFLTIVTPFLGLPSPWYEYIFPVFGIVILSIGIYIRVRCKYSELIPDDNADTTQGDVKDGSAHTSDDMPPSNPPSVA